MLWFVGGSLALSVAIDLGRLYWPLLGRVFNFFFGRWLRSFESERLTGATYFLIGSFLTVLSFPDWRIATAALFFLSLGDLAAALIGKKWGRTQIFDKTLEGSLACFVVSFGVSLLLVNWRVGLAGALAATVAEVLPVRINDNVLVPLVSAGVMAISAALL